LFYLYDYYDYQVAGAKKEWYKLLYEGANPGPMPTFGLYASSFALEFFILSLHCLPCTDFYFWVDETGVQSQFIGDKINSLCMLRLYTAIRVIRDYTSIYSRRRLVYDGGYRERGGPEITFKLALKANLAIYEGAFVAAAYLSALFILGYMYHCGERDVQPELYTLMNTLWLTAFQFAAMDFNGMAPLSEFGVFMSAFVIISGLVILSMLVNTIFNTVMLSSYEGYAIDWLQQYELCEQEREEAGKVLKVWWNKKMNRIENGGKKNEDSTIEANHIIQLVQMFKKLREVSFMVQRNNPSGNLDPMTELQVNMKKDLCQLARKVISKEDAVAVIGDGVDTVDTTTDNSVFTRSAALAGRVKKMEETQEAVLRLVEEIYKKQKGKAPE